MSAVHEGRSFTISKWEVFHAWEAVKANGEACGVDGQSMEAFALDLDNNLYRIWNRLTSGSYFPPAVRGVKISKSTGGHRQLGIPTVGDRVAQMVVKNRLEPVLEPVFDPWSFGYRPNRSALDAADMAREQCFKHWWVVDLDIKGFFDTIDHSLLERALDRHCSCRWQRLYIKRWLEADVMHKDGRIEQRTMGTPQGGVISPLLANLFLHYVFDDWMRRSLPGVRFERYADDIVCHCRSERQARYVLTRVGKRMNDCGLTLHPGKSRIVLTNPYSDLAKPGTTESFSRSFDFVGFTFGRRIIRRKDGTLGPTFTPAISHKNSQDKRAVIRQILGRSTTHMDLATLAAELNPRLRGWYNYYCAHSWWITIERIGYYVNGRIVNWAMRKYKRFKNAPKKAWKWFDKLKQAVPDLFWHWTVNVHDVKSRVR